MLTMEAMSVLKKRYLMENETPETMFWRVAKHVAQAEGLYGADTAAAAEEYFELLNSLTFLPNSPTLMNSGRERQAQLAACFVLPIEDSLPEIFETLKNAAIIHKSGGGTGFAFSRLRHKGDMISSTGGTASGPISFMEVFNAATQVVRQGAVRSGANMAVLRVDHPDIKEFVAAKAVNGRLSNFNLSVGITEQFMNAVAHNEEYDLISPRTGKITGKVNAKDVFELIVKMAWHNGEPGLFFLDTTNKSNPTPQLGVFETPNPCAEQPLLPYESCVLGSINLTKIVSGSHFKRHIDYERLRRIIRLAVRFLDDVIDINSYPLPKVEEATKLTRKIGLGIMGLADMYILLDIPYASEAAAGLTSQIMKFMTNEARQASAELAAKRGAFPAFAESIYPQAFPLRNATVTTIAPTGSISIIAGCSSGIEPLFALAFTRNVMEGEVLVSKNPYVINYLEERKLLNDKVLSAIISAGSIKDTEVPVHVKQVLATAGEISAKWHITQLAAAQRYTDNGVSKTVNLPNAATMDDVAQVFFTAFEAGCKGVTVYRSGSREQQVLHSGLAGCLECKVQ